MEPSERKILLSKEALFWFLFLIYTALSFYLFYHQAAASGDGRFLSDMPSYVSGVLGTNERDPYPYRLFFWLTGALYAALPIELSAAFVTVLLNSLTVFILRFYIEKYFASPVQVSLSAGGKIFALIRPFVPVLLVFACLTASMIVIPVDFLYKFPGQFYIGQGSGNMWHNATYLATRPFAALAFFLFIELSGELREKINLKKLLLLAAALFLSVFAKPTFAVVMLPAAALFILCRLAVSKFKDIKNALLLGAAFVPALADMLRQYLPVFGKSEKSGIGFGVGDVWGQYTKSIILSVALCFAFALFVLFFFRPRAENGVLWHFSLVFLAVSLFEGIFLYEKGPRMADGNFMQGYLHAMFFVFTAAAVIWLGGDKKQKPAVNAAALLLFSAHTVSGIWYFINLLSGNKFY